MISAFLIVRNEERNLRECLESIVPLADEIVVVDSESEDETVRVARQFTDRVIERRFTNYGDQKNFALSQVRGDWALSIDADERVPRELCEEILAAVASPDPAPAYRVARKNFFRGRWMRSFYPDYQIRLFRPAAARFVGSVHEVVEVTGRVDTLRTPLLHYGAPDLATCVWKLRRYPRLDAHKRLEAGERFGLASLWKAPGRELRRYLVTRRSWRDGVNGLLLAGFMAAYEAAVAWHALRARRA